MSNTDTQLVLSSQFRKKSISERLHFLSSHIPKDKIPKDINTYLQSNNNTNTLADSVVESAIGVANIPIGIVSNLLVNNTYYHVPIATEEASVCAAASFGARIIKNIRAKSSHALQDAQIALSDVGPKEEQKIKDALPNITNALIASVKNMHARGGGLRDVSFYKTPTNLFIIHACFDTCNAMGANVVNSAMESIKPLIQKILHNSKASILSAILSNFSDLRLAHAECKILLKDISSQENVAHTIATKIQQMCEWAKSDVRRAVTHNKGIMNGISAFALSTGNDTRALEAASHSWASVGGNYMPLSFFQYDEEQKCLNGKIEIPALLASVGGSTQMPHALWTKLILEINTQKTIHSATLNCIAAALGLTQNFAALRALVSEGIQKGHMKLHNKKTT